MAKRSIVLKEEDFSKAVKPPKPSGFKNLGDFLRANVVEFKFRRRSPLLKNPALGHKSKTRRILCTANWRLINSPITRLTFKWKAPKAKRRRLYSWYKKRNLMIVWDIMFQDFRILSLDDWEIIAAIPVVDLMNKVRFFIFYKFQLSKITQKKREDFADS